VATAAEQLRDEGVCYFVDGREISETPERTTLRTDVEVITAEELREYLADAVAEGGAADVQETLYGLPDTAVFEDVEATIRESVESMLGDGYPIAGTYSDHISNGTNPVSVALVPTVQTPVGEDILKRIGEYDEGDQFSLNDVAPEPDEREARTFLLRNLGNDEPAYMLETGSSNPADWSPGTRFQIPGGTWDFTQFSAGPSELQEAWQDEKEENGEVTEGSLRFTIPGHDIASGVGEVIEVQDSDTTVDLTIESGQPVMHVTRLFEELPENARDVDARFEFKK
jgi:hypothetical protein